MTFRVTVRLDGLRQAIDRVRGAKRKIPARAMRKAIKVAVVPMVGTAKVLAPKDTGTLKRAMTARVKSYNRGQYLLGVVGPRKKKYANGKNPSKYAHLVELGHRIAVRGKLHRFDRPGVPAGLAGINRGFVAGRRFMRTAARIGERKAIAAFERSIRLNVTKDFTDA